VIICVSTVVLTTSIFILALGKFLAPNEAVKAWVRKVLAGIAEAWAGVNNSLISLYIGKNWDIQVPQEIDRKGCYLVNCNHQTLVDIPVLQYCFNRRLPFFRFFLKSQLIWVPFLGGRWRTLN